MPCPNCACKDCDHFFRRPIHLPYRRVPPTTGECACGGRWTEAKFHSAEECSSLVCRCEQCEEKPYPDPAVVAKYHRDRMEALKLPERNCLSPEELTRLYNKNVERAYDYGIESITGRVPNGKV